jgi:hypothetical protein
MSAKIPRIIEPASYETVQYGYNQSKDLFIVGWKERSAIAIDETNVKWEGWAKLYVNGLLKSSPLAS